MNSDSLKQKIQGFLTKIKELSRTQKMIILFVMVLVPAGIAISAFLILYFKVKRNGDFSSRLLKDLFESLSLRL